MITPPPLLPERVTFPPEGWMQHPADARQYFNTAGEVLWDDDLRKRYDIPADIPAAQQPLIEAEADPALLRLIQDTTGIKPELPATGEFAASPELAAALQEKPTEKVEMPLPAQWDEAGNAATRREQSAWEVDSPLGHIEVNEQEKMLFVKQAFHNKEIQLGVKLGHPADPVHLTVRSISNKNLAAIYISLGNDRKAGLFGPPDDDDKFDAGFFATRMQVLSMMLQVVSGGEGFKPWISDEELASISEEDLAARLSADASAWGAALSAPRHVMFVKAVRIFEYKFKLCKEAMANPEGFSDPAS